MTFYEAKKLFDFMNNLRWRFERMSDISSDSSAFSSNKYATESKIKISSRANDSSRFITSRIKERLDINIVELIEKDLEFYEKVSLMFLLYEDSDLEYALQRLLYTSNKNSNLSLISDWCRTNQKDWQVKLLEALSITESFHVLSKLGFMREETVQHFLSDNKHASLYITRIRKVLYNFCESLSQLETTQLIGSINKELTQKGYEIPEIKYLEIGLLFWASRNYIKFHQNNIQLDNLYAHLKAIDLLEAKYTLDISSCINKHEKIQKKDEKVESQLDSKREETYTIINPSDVGICLIINQENFQNRATDPKLTASEFFSEKKLTDREGTEEDVRTLTETFANFNFTVIEKKNLNHNEIVKCIRAVMMDDVKEHHSMFFLFILTHGLNDYLFGVDSVCISLSSIENELFLHSKLFDKPKVIIIQACRGEERNAVMTDGGVSKVREPDTEVKPANEPSVKIRTPHYYSDLFVGSATVPGFVSYRHKFTGSWFIQVLCEFINKEGRTEHFDTIFRHVKKDMRYNNRYNVRLPESNGILDMQMSENRSTLTKELYLVIPSWTSS